MGFLAGLCGDGTLPRLGKWENLVEFFAWRAKDCSPAGFGGDLRACWAKRPVESGWITACRSETRTSLGLGVLP